MIINKNSHTNSLSNQESKRPANQLGCNANKSKRRRTFRQLPTQSNRQKPHLPNEMFGEISRFLDHTDILRYRETSKYFKAISKSSMEKMSPMPFAKNKTLEISSDLELKKADIKYQDIKFTVHSIKLTFRPNTDTFKSLANFQNIQTLKLSEINLEDTDLKGISSLNKLKTLNISGNNITDSAITHLSGLNTLQSLNASHNNISNVGALQIADLSSITHLNLRFNHIGDTGVDLLVSLGNFEELEIDYNNINFARNLF